MVILHKEYKSEILNETYGLYVTGKTKMSDCDTCKQDKSHAE